MAREAAGDSLTSTGRGEGEALGCHGNELMARESWQRGCRGNADSQGEKYISTPSYKNHEHKKDQRKQRLWRKPRRGRRRGRRGASTNSSRVEHVHTVPCLALGMGKGLSQPRARLRVPRSGRKKGGEHWSKQSQLSQHVCGRRAQRPWFRLQSCAGRARVATRHCSQPRGSGAVPEVCPSQQPSQQHQAEEETDSGPSQGKYRGPPRFSKA